MLTTDIPSVEPGATDNFKAHSWLMNYAVDEENEESKPKVSQEKEDAMVLKKKKSRDDLVMPSISGQLDHLQQQQEQPPPQPAGNLLDQFGVSFDFPTDPVIDSPLFSSVPSPFGEKEKPVEDPATASTTSIPQTPQSINEEVGKRSFDPDVSKPIRTRRPSIASMLIRRSSRILSSSAFSKKNGSDPEVAAVEEPSKSGEEDDGVNESELDKSQKHDQEEEQEEEKEEVSNTPSAELPLKQDQDEDEEESGNTPTSTASISIPKALDRRSSRILDGITRKVMHVRHTTSMVFRRATSHVSSSIAVTADKISPNSAATTTSSSNSSEEELRQAPSDDADISSIEEEEEEEEEEEVDQDKATSLPASSPRLSSSEDEAEEDEAEANGTEDVKTTHHSTNISIDALSRKLFSVKNSVSRMKNIFASKRAPPPTVV